MPYTHKLYKQNSLQIYVIDLRISKLHSYSILTHLHQILHKNKLNC